MFDVDITIKEMSVVLQKRRSTKESYPATIRDLINACSERLSSKISWKEFTRLGRTRRFRSTMVAARVSDVESPIVLVEDLSLICESPETFKFLLRLLRRENAAGYSLPQVAKPLFHRLQKPFRKTVTNWVDGDKLPEGIAAVWIKGTRYFFLLTDLQGRPTDEALSKFITFGSSSHVCDEIGAAQSYPLTFAQLFEITFDRLDRAHGAFNNVSLLSMRQEFPQFSRSQFDKGLQQLREMGKFALSAAEGGRRKTGKDELEAGVKEGGCILVNVSKR